MGNIKLNVQMYKYGQKREILVYSFNSDTELNQWIKRTVNYSNQLEIDEKECGENLTKWQGSFSYNNKEYFLAFDL